MSRAIAEMRGTRRSARAPRLVTSGLPRMAQKGGRGGDGGRYRGGSSEITLQLVVIRNPICKCELLHICVQWATLGSDRFKGRFAEHTG
jgi:hypothetical protein